MKRYFFTFVLLTLLTSILLSCSRFPSVDTVAYHILKLYSKIPPCSQYVKDGENGNYGYISSEDFFFLYTGKKEKLPEWDMIDSFRIIMSDSERPFEIHVIKVMASSDAPEIKKLLKRRADLISFHNKTEESYKSYEPSIFVRGRYVILAVTPDNEAIKLLLKKIL